MGSPHVQLPWGPLLLQCDNPRVSLGGTGRTFRERGSSAAWRIAISRTHFELIGPCPFCRPGSCEPSTGKASRQQEAIKLERGGFFQICIILPFTRVPVFQPNITRSQSEAVEILRGYASQINGDSSRFAQLAKEHSDCSSHDKEGDLGWFKKGQMQRPFEDATYSLKVGEMSDVITTDSGVHLIMRTG
jgi:PPIC-type PPIASE domain